MTSVLAIETSCDETSVAVVRDGKEVLSNVVASQVTDHVAFGGVVPEVAARRHLECLGPVFSAAMSQADVQPHQLDGVAATHGPGLIGALLVGVSAAKTIAMAWNKPYVGVNHVEGHLFACSLEHPEVKFPMVVLLVAGGHTRIVHVTSLGNYAVVGSTIDDAAGEAFDKVARYLGLGYPGGPEIDRLAQVGDRSIVRFPRGLASKGFDFSFSGLKTAVVNYVRDNDDVSNQDIAACFQEAVVDSLCTKTLDAAKALGVETVCIGGGVAANRELRSELVARGLNSGIKVWLPSPQYCTDNAAMIGAAACWQLDNLGPTKLDSGAYPGLKLGDRGSIG